VQSQTALATPQVVSFQSEHLTLQGLLYKPEGPGPFPAVVYNHGSAPGMLNQQAFEELGPLFAGRGWVFFAPYRRGQGLSASAGPYIGDQIAAARNRGVWLALVVAVPSLVVLLVLLIRKRRGWLRLVWGVAFSLLAVLAVHWSGVRAGAAAMVRSLATDHLRDQLAALAWLQRQSFVDEDRIATAGNSFGGIEALLGAERGGYCAAIDASGGAESWAAAPQLRVLMAHAVRNSKAPILFFQAENDYDLSPSRALSKEMKDAGKEFELKIYPAFGTSPSEAHTFAWAGSAVWADDVFQFLDRHCAK
jgi:dipeptidyl aminopeptidase/acylaminoacyl peptidase